MCSNADFGAFRKPVRVADEYVNLDAPDVHIVPYLSGGLGRLVRRIETDTVPQLDEYGYHTNSEGHFEPKTPCLVGLRYRVKQVIDSTGQTAVVVLAEDVFNGRRLVVVKVLHVHWYNVGTQESHVLRRLAVADPLNHAHTLRLLNTVTFDGHYCLVFEPLLPDPLTMVFQELPNHTVLRSIKRVTLRLLATLGFLHQQNMIHTDLKPDNILLKYENDLDSVHVVDFGNAIHCVHQEMSLYYKDFELQALIYRAPEVMFGIPFGPEIDMWSLGCILAELYLGRPLFPGTSKAETLEQVHSVLGPFPTNLFRRGKFFKELKHLTSDLEQSNGTMKLLARLECTDPMFADLLAGLLRYNPAERLTASEAARHPFLASLMPIGFLLPTNGPSNCYPPVWMSPQVYTNKPVVAPDIKKRQLSTLELLKMGTEEIPDTPENLPVQPSPRIASPFKTKLAENEEKSVNGNNDFGKGSNERFADHSRKVNVDIDDTEDESDAADSPSEMSVIGNVIKETKSDSLSENLKEKMVSLLKAIKQEQEMVEQDLNKHRADAAKLFKSPRKGCKVLSSGDDERVLKGKGDERRKQEEKTLTEDSRGSEIVRPCAKISSHGYELGNRCNENEFVKKQTQTNVKHADQKNEQSVQAHPEDNRGTEVVRPCAKTSAHVYEFENRCNKNISPKGLIVKDGIMGNHEHKTETRKRCANYNNGETEKSSHSDEKQMADTSKKVDSDQSKNETKRIQNCTNRISKCLKGRNNDPSNGMKGFQKNQNFAENFNSFERETSQKCGIVSGYVQSWKATDSSSHQNVCRKMYEKTSSCSSFENVQTGNRASKLCTDSSVSSKSGLTGHCQNSVRSETGQLDEEENLNLIHSDNRKSTRIASEQKQGRRYPNVAEENIHNCTARPESVQSSKSKISTSSGKGALSCDKVSSDNVHNTLDRSATKSVYNNQHWTSDPNRKNDNLSIASLESHTNSSMEPDGDNLNMSYRETEMKSELDVSKENHHVIADSPNHELKKISGHHLENSNKIMGTCRDLSKESRISDKHDSLGTSEDSSRESYVSYNRERHVISQDLSRESRISDNHNRLGTSQDSSRESYVSSNRERKGTFQDSSRERHISDNQNIPGTSRDLSRERHISDNQNRLGTSRDSSRESHVSYNREGHRISRDSSKESHDSYNREGHGTSRDSSKDSHISDYRKRPWTSEINSYDESLRLPVVNSSGQKKRRIDRDEEDPALVSKPSRTVSKKKLNVHVRTDEDCDRGAQCRYGNHKVVTGVGHTVQVDVEGDDAFDEEIDQVKFGQTFTITSTKLNKQKQFKPRVHGTHGFSGTISDVQKSDNEINQDFLLNSDNELDEDENGDVRNQVNFLSEGNYEFEDESTNLPVSHAIKPTNASKQKQGRRHPDDAEENVASKQKQGRRHPDDAEDHAYKVMQTFEPICKAKKQNQEIAHTNGLEIGGGRRQKCIKKRFTDTVHPELLKPVPVRASDRFPERANIRTDISDNQATLGGRKTTPGVADQVDTDDKVLCKHQVDLHVGNSSKQTDRKSHCFRRPQIVPPSCVASRDNFPELSPINGGSSQLVPSVLSDSPEIYHKPTKPHASRNVFRGVHGNLTNKCVSGGERVRKCVTNEQGEGRKRNHVYNEQPEGFDSYNFEQEMRRVKRRSNCLEALDTVHRNMHEGIQQSKMNKNVDEIRTMHDRIGQSESNNNLGEINRWREDYVTNTHAQHFDREKLDKEYGECSTRTEGEVIQKMEMTTSDIQSSHEDMEGEKNRKIRNRRNVDQLSDQFDVQEMGNVKKTLATKRKRAIEMKTDSTFGKEYSKKETLKMRENGAKMNKNKVNPQQQFDKTELNTKCVDKGDKVARNEGNSNGIEHMEAFTAQGDRDPYDFRDTPYTDGKKSGTNTFAERIEKKQVKRKKKARKSLTFDNDSE